MNLWGQYGLVRAMKVSGIDGGKGRRIFCVMFPENVIFSSLEANVLMVYFPKRVHLHLNISKQRRIYTFLASSCLFIKQSPNSFQSCKMTQNYAKNALRQFSEVIP
ncbi:hypothetical protein Bca4012_074225 [Brassica carinata]|uniref:(rape) hypothetical protein n=1 Tax=Brassica napus TaxID=3708 RepID=A0A816LD44_BRANA|nr:unnamed protein product [Brassica napus]